jgi:hypothetical protein
MMLKRAFAAALVLSFALPAFAEGPAFLFDILREKPYRASWEALMKDVQPTPDWLVQFNKNFDGVSGSLVQASADGKTYDLSFVCKPEDCANHRFVVAFEAAATPHAYGALGGKNNSPAFYGDPSPALQAAMNKALGR